MTPGSARESWDPGSSHARSAKDPHQGREPCVRHGSGRPCFHFYASKVTKDPLYEERYIVFEPRVKSKDLGILTRLTDRFKYLP